MKYSNDELLEIIVYQNSIVARYFQYRFADWDRNISKLKQNHIPYESFRLSILVRDTGKIIYDGNLKDYLESQK